MQAGRRAGKQAGKYYALYTSYIEMPNMPTEKETNIVYKSLVCLLPKACESNLQVEIASKEFRYPVNKNKEREKFPANQN